MKRQKRKPLAEINVVPYIDVMLVLLVIFMITAPMLTQGVEVDLPKTAANAVETEDDIPLILSVDKKGRYFINSEGEGSTPLSMENVLVRVRAELQLAHLENKKKTLLVRGDKEVNYGRVVNLMAILKNAGVEKIGLMTKPLPFNVTDSDAKKKG